MRKRKGRPPPVAVRRAAELSVRDRAAAMRLFRGHLGYARCFALGASQSAARTAPGEIESAALEGLWAASLGFDAGRGLAFTTYAMHKMRGAVADWGREDDQLPRLTRRRIKAGAIDAPRRRPYPQLEDRIAAASVLRIDLADVLRRSLGCLAPRGREAVELVFLEELTQTEAAQRMGISQSRVSEIVIESLARLREDLAGRGVE